MLPRPRRFRRPHCFGPCPSAGNDRISPGDSERMPRCLCRRWREIPPKRERALPGTRASRSVYLEVQPYANLAGAVPAGRGHLAEQRARDGGVDASELMPVKQVVELDAQLPAEALIEAHILRQR